MPLVTHFKELRVYQQAFEAAMHVFELSKRWPKEERYSLTDQIRRSSRSVCANDTPIPPNAQTTYRGAGHEDTEVQDES